MSLDNKSKEIFASRDFATYALAYNSRRVFVYEDKDYTTTAVITPSLEIVMYIFDKKNKVKNGKVLLEFPMKHNTLKVSVYCTSNIEDLYGYISDTVENCRDHGADVRDEEGFMKLVPGKARNGNNLKRAIKVKMMNMAEGITKNMFSVADWDILAYTEDPDSDMAQAIIAQFALEDDKIQVGWTTYKSNITGIVDGVYSGTREEFRIFDIIEDAIKKLNDHYKPYHVNWLTRLIMSITDNVTMRRRERRYYDDDFYY